MPLQLTKLQTRRAALILAPLLVAAVVGVLVSREIGWLRQEHTLQVTLSAVRTCETPESWGVPTRVHVGWRVGGGVAPYYTEIDGRLREGSAELRGKHGSTWLHCVRRSGPLTQRQLAGIDSGWKTIRAKVTDAEGRTGAADIRVYVVVNNRSSSFHSGEMYRIDNWFVTIPRGLSVSYAGISEVSSCEASEEDYERDPYICESWVTVQGEGKGHQFQLGFGSSSGRERVRYVWSGGELLDWLESSNDEPLDPHLDALLNELVDSISRWSLPPPP